MLGRLLNGRSEERAISFQSLFASGADIAPTTLSGTVVTQENSLKIGAVYAAVRLLSDTISTLPADTYVRRDGERLPFSPKPAWVDRPDIGVTREEMVQQVMVSLLLDGNAFVRVYRSGTGANVGLPTALVVLDPTNVEIRRVKDSREIEYVFDRRIVIPQSDMVHIVEMRRPGSLRGVSKIEQMKDTLGLASALTEFSARFFGQGSVTSGILETPSSLTREQAMDLKDTFESSHRGLQRSNRVGILGGGAKFVKTGVDPEQAQMLESRQFAVEEIARIFRIPQHMLQVANPGAMSYASVEQNAIQFAQYTLAPYIAKLEAAFSVLLPGEAFMKFNLDGLLRGDLQTRYSAYSTALQSGFMSINDVRRFEDQRPVEGGDAFRVPLANVNVEAANITEQEKRSKMAIDLIQAGFDPQQALAVVGMPPIDHTGLPSVQLQNPANLEPDDPEAAYPVRDLDPAAFAEAIGGAIRSMQPPVVNVNVPEQPPRTKKVQRDAAGNINEIVEE